ncbi:autotransporter outer membrane beta-barrel domain-containing protein [Roseibium sediminis]|uniref:autotransporter outer membrane beta-barrel domain-containing protein n=1 Tax=Roseibium sediminis TaxID=1775174 RepID=UPI0013759998|nr:autotransporter outer membrane beta-barrel domain-containing protein [Roseibium sediminis]
MKLDNDSLVKKASSNDFQPQSKKLTYLAVLLAASSGIALMASSSANAQCTNLAGVITCDGNDTDGIYSAAGTSAVTVQTGATVDDSGNGGNGAAGGTGAGVIEIDGGISGNFTNYGSVSTTGTTENAINVDGTITGNFRNEGTLTGEDTVEMEDISGTFINNGTITAEGSSSVSEAVDIDDVGNGLINTGKISAQSDLSIADGIEAGNITGNFDNSGTISATAGTNIADAVETRDIYGDFINSGTITAQTGEAIADAVETNDITGNFLNSGTISSHAGTSIADAVEVDVVSGNFTNSGTITSISETSTSNAVETGNIGGSFTNSGTITAKAGTNQATGVETDNIAGGFTNTGTISAIATDDIARGVYALTISGLFLNSGTISASASTSNADAILADTLSSGLRNDGTITSSNYAIRTTGANQTIVNNGGTITGSIDLGAGANAFNNLAGGIFNSRATVVLGAGNQFSNDGVWSPGGTDSIVTTNVATGNLVQGTSGTYQIDLNLADGSGDLANVSAGSASLAGTVKTRITALGTAARTYTILTASSGVTDNGLTLLHSPVLNASLLYPDANTLQISVQSIDFNADGLNSNQQNLASTLNQANTAGGGQMSSLLLELVNGSTGLSDYQRDLNQLLPAAQVASQAANLSSAQKFTDSLFSCPTMGNVASVVREGRCVWARVDGHFLSADNTSSTIGFDERAYGFSAGVQFTPLENWALNFAANYERAFVETNDGAKSDGNRFQFGSAVKYQPGQFLFGGAIGAGFAQLDTTRRITISNNSGVASSDTDTVYVAGQLKAAYTMPLNGWYAKPSVDLNLTHLNRGDARETGGGAANLLISGGNETFFSIVPAVEVGTEFQLSDTMTVKPFAKGGLSFTPNNEHSLAASFIMAPGGVDSFTTTTVLEDFSANLETGLTIFSPDNVSVTMGYKGQLSEKTQQHGIFAKGTIRF